VVLQIDHAPPVYVRSPFLTISLDRLEVVGFYLKLTRAPPNLKTRRFSLLADLILLTRVRGHPFLLSKFAFPHRVLLFNHSQSHPTLIN